MYQITKNQIQDFIFSLNDNKGGFYLQKGFNQSTLMSTSFSILTLELIDSLNILKKKKYKEFFLQNQDKKSGLFIDPLSRLKDANSIDLESSYIHYQTTAFSISAIDALGGQPNHKLAFLDSFRGKKKLSSFFHTIDWKNAWHESNKIMFLLQFFSYDFLKNKNEESYDNIVFILDFLDNYQDPRTGLWGTQYKASTFVGMAAAYHFLIFYKYFNRKINFPNKIFQNVFILQMKDGLFHPFGGGGACEDLDAIDVVSKVTSELSADSINNIKLAYNALIQNYDKNGGFCWAKRPQFPFLNGIKYLNPRSALFNYDMVKWIIKNNYIGSFLPFFRENYVYKYSNWDQMKFNIKISDSWSTWFRLLSIATLEKLSPDLKKNDINFKFRGLPSIGWLNDK